MAAPLIDREASNRLYKDRSVIYGSGFVTSSARFDVRRPLNMLSDSARSNFSPSSGSFAAATQERKDLIATYFSTRNGSTKYVEPPALIGDGTWSDWDFISNVNPVTDALDPHADYVGSFWNTVYTSTCIIYPRNSVTSEVGTPFVSGRPQVWWVDADLTGQTTWMSTDVLTVVGFNFCPVDNFYPTVFARDTTSGTIYELQCFGFVWENTGEPFGVSCCGRQFSLVINDSNNTPLPAGTYEFVISHNMHAYGIASIGVRTVTAAAEEAFTVYDCRGTITLRTYSPAVNHTLDPLNTAEQNSKALAAAMLEARLRYDDDTSKRVRLVLPRGKFKVNRQLPVLPGVVLDLGQGTELIADTSVVFQSQPVETDLDANSLYSRVPAAWQSTFRSSTYFRAYLLRLISPTDSSTPGPEVRGSSKDGQGGVLDICDQLLPKTKANMPYAAVGIDPTSNATGYRSYLRNFTIRSRSLRGGSLIQFGVWLGENPSDVSATDKISKHWAIYDVHFECLRAISCNPQGSVERGHIRGCTGLAPQGSGQRGVFINLLQKEIFISQCSWEGYFRGLVSARTASCSYHTAVIDSHPIRTGVALGGSEQVLWEHGDRPVVTVDNWAVGGNPLVLRVTFPAGASPVSFVAYRPGNVVVIFDGPCVGQVRIIQSYALVSGTTYDLTLDRAWTGTPTGSSSVSVGNYAYQCATGYIIQRGGHHGILCYAGCIDLLIANYHADGVVKPIFCFGLTRLTESSYNTFDPVWDIKTVNCDFINTDLAVFVVSTTLRTTTGLLVQNIQDHSSRSHEAVWNFKTETNQVLPSPPAAPWPTLLREVSWTGTGIDAFASGAYQFYGNSYAGFPIRRLLRFSPFQVQTELKGAGFWIRNDVKMNGHDYNGTTLDASDFFGPVDSVTGGFLGVIRPTGYSLPGSSAADAQVMSYLTNNTDALTTRVTTLEGQYTTLNTTTGTHTSQISTINTTLTSLQATDASLTTRVSDAEGEIDVLQSASTSYASTLASHGSRLTSVESVNTSQGSTLTSHGSRLTSAEGNITTLQGQVTTVQGQITTLQGVDSGLDARVTDVEEAIANQVDLTGDVATLQTQIITVTTTANNAIATATSAQSAVTALQGTVNSQTTTINGHTSQLSSQQSSITALQSSVGSLTTQVNTNTASLASLLPTVSDLSSVVGQHTSQIDDHEARITDVQNNCCDDAPPENLAIGRTLILRCKLTTPDNFFGFLPPSGRTLQPGEEFAWPQSDFMFKLNLQGQKAIDAYEYAIGEGQQLEIVADSQFNVPVF